MKPLVIVGTGLAGYNLAKEFRKLDAERPLLILTRDDGRNYSKPMLSTGFTKGKEADALAMNTVEQMREQLKADIRTGVSVNAIDRNAKTLQVEGETIAPRVRLGGRARIARAAPGPTGAGSRGAPRTTSSPGPAPTSSRPRRSTARPGRPGRGRPTGSAR